MTQRRPAFTMIEVLVVVAIIAVLIMLLLPAVQSAREAARRAQCSNNLIQLGIALQNYEATHLVLPPGVINTTGPIVETADSYQFNWITQILPYFEQRNVYQHLDFEIGVYAANNLTARSVSLGTLICPSEPFIRKSFVGFGPSAPTSALSGIPDPATSSYAACHNDVEAPIDTGNLGVFFLNSHVRLDEIEDGLSHTIFLGEKRPPGDELGWASGTRATLRNTGTEINRTKLDPTDLTPFMNRINSQNEGGGFQTADAPIQETVATRPLLTTAIGGFSSNHPNGSNFLFGDGSVHYLRNNINADVYRLLGNRLDGVPIGDDQL